VPSIFVTLGLYVGGAGFLLVMAVSWRSGTAPEWAVTRGLLAFGAFAFLGWLAAYIAASAPPLQTEHQDTTEPESEATADQELGARAESPRGSEERAADDNKPAAA
jgi:hypothetical protein